MALIADGARFPLLQHMLSSPMNVAILVMAVAALMVAAMILMWK